MATFSVNQVRQLYVANAVKTAPVLATATEGTIAVKGDSTKSTLYFVYKGVSSLMRSDLIDVKNIISAKATDADTMTHKLKSYTVTLDSDVNEGKPVSGQDYILRVAFRQYIGMSDEDQYFKYGVVHAYNKMVETPKLFYVELALSLVKNFSRELVPLVKISLKTASGSDPVETSTKKEDLNGDYTGVVIEEVEQPWTLGKESQVPVYFTVQPTTITFEGDEVIWGTVTENASTKKVTNGHDIADLEYFCMGERGDIYRNVGWPNVIDTKYLVDPSKQYNTIDIHYAFTDSNESIQKSEKTLTIVVPKVGTTNATSNALTNNIIKAINTATGLTIAELDKSSS